MCKFVKRLSRLLSSHHADRATRMSHLVYVQRFIRTLAPVAINRQLVRIGADSDGGYLVPDDFEGLQVAVSPGVSTEISFDLGMADRGLDVLMADASVAGPPLQNPHFHFVPKFVDVFEDDRNIRLDNLCKMIVLDSGKDRILQMDIEGAEYRVILDLSDEALKSFRIMVIEFHRLDLMFSSFSWQLIRATFQKLLRYHHVVHIHPNNNVEFDSRQGIDIPRVMEFTFYRRDRAVVIPDGKLVFPHSLDRDNTIGKPSLVLPACWQ